MAGRRQKNHVVLKPELPLGLAAGAGMITGIEENPLTRAKIELGRQLYFDPRLSSRQHHQLRELPRSRSSATPRTRSLASGIEGLTGNRNSPVAYNRILSGPQFWDGRADSLEAQAVGPIANPIEMGNTHEKACIEISQGHRRLRSKQFEAIFPGRCEHRQRRQRRLASFERAVVTGPAPWDYYEQLEPV